MLLTVSERDSLTSLNVSSIHDPRSGFANGAAETPLAASAAKTVNETRIFLPFKNAVKECVK
jgi:hypothetical protein